MVNNPKIHEGWTRQQILHCEKFCAYSRAACGFTLWWFRRSLRRGESRIAAFAGRHR